jgi:hypothetical protein
MSVMGARGHARIECSLGHRRGDFHHQARVKWLGDQVLWAKRQGLAHIGGCHDFALLGLRQLGNRVHGRDFHLQRDGGGAAVQRTPEDVGEAQDVVDLVGVVGAAGGHDGVVAHGFDVFGVDLGVGVGQRKNQRLGGHGLDHVLLEHTTGRQTQEHVGTGNHFAQRAVIGFLHKLDLVFVHQFGAAFVDHARQIGDPDVFARDAQLDQQTQTSQGRCACAGGDQLDFLGVFADDFEAVQNGRAHHDGGAMLVVMKDRDLHALAQFALNVEAIRRLDVFEVDATKRRLQ